MRSFLLILLLTWAVYSFSGHPGDSTYIECNKSGLSLSLQNTQRIMNAEFTRSDIYVPTLDYQPNSLSKFGPRLAYNGLAVALMFNSKTYEKDPNYFGETKTFGLDIKANSRMWLMMFDFLNVQGFYLPNPSRFKGPNLPPVPPAIRGDIHLGLVGFSYTRILNGEKFSMKYLVNQTEVQKKSAGSLLLTAGIYLNSYRSDSSIVPKEVIIPYGALNEFERANFNSLTIQPGYVHTLMLGKKIGASVRANVGLGVQGQRLSSLMETKTKISGLIKADVLFALNYMRPRFFCGVSSEVSSLQTKISDVSFKNNLVEGKFYFGWRFRNVKLFQKKSFLHKIPFLKDVLLED